MEEFHKLTEILYGLDNPANNLDARNWWVSGNGLFTECSLVREECTFPHASIQIPRAPRVFFCLWLAVRDVILTAENLIKKRIKLVLHLI